MSSNETDKINSPDHQLNVKCANAEENGLTSTDRKNRVRKNGVNGSPHAALSSGYVTKPVNWATR